MKVLSMNHRLIKLKVKKKITVMNIQNYTTIYHTIIRGKMQNTELSAVFENVKRGETRKQLFSNELQELTTYVTKDQFASSSL
jgi:lipid A disaccharide synthetase